jgi:hypothetical protein
MRIALWTVLSLIVVAAPSRAADEAWRVEKERDGVQISTRAVAGWSIREIRGTVRVPGRLSAVVAELADPEASRELNELTVESKVVQRDSDTRYHLYNAMKLSWPVSDRDIVNLRQISQDPASGVVTIDDTAVDDTVPQRKGYVRMIRSRQLWTLTPAGGEVAVEMHALSDPNGPIPAAIINLMAIDAPLKTLLKLKQLAQSPRYADVRLPYIKDPADH